MFNDEFIEECHRPDLEEKFQRKTIVFKGYLVTGKKEFTQCFRIAQSFKHKENQFLHCIYQGVDYEEDPDAWLKAQQRLDKKEQEFIKRIEEEENND